jgi:hypothetical protein
MVHLVAVADLDGHLGVLWKKASSAQNAARARNGRGKYMLRVHLVAVADLDGHLGVRWRGSNGG